MMNNLPIEIYNLLFFNYLHLENLANLRLVCKKFNYILKAYKIKELNFFKNEYDKKDAWFNGLRRINSMNSLHITKLSILNSLSFNLNHLKRLRTHNLKENVNFKLEDLNRFNQIEHLELFEIKNWLQSQKMIKLKLDNLKLLFIYFEIELSLQIEAANLEVLNLDYELLDRNEFSDYQPLKSINFLHPTTVKQLTVISNSFYSLSKLDNLSIFTGVNHFNCNINSRLDQINIFKKFQNLKSLQVCQTVANRNDKLFKPNLDILIDVMKQKGELKSIAKMYFENIELLSYSSIREIGRMR